RLLAPGAVGGLRLAEESDSLLDRVIPLLRSGRRLAGGFPGTADEGAKTSQHHRYHRVAKLTHRSRLHKGWTGNSYSRKANRMPVNGATNSMHFRGRPQMSLAVASPGAATVCPHSCIVALPMN